MGKIQDIESLVKRCEEVIMSNYASTAEELVNDIISVYSNDIPNIINGLTLYQINFDFDAETSATDFIGDLRILKAKLINLKNDLEDKEKQRKDELEILKIKSSGFNIYNTNTANATANAQATITLDQTIGKLVSLLPPDEIEELEEKLAALELSMKNGDKEKSSSKKSKVLKFIADKGIDVAIGVLPYLCKLVG